MLAPKSRCYTPAPLSGPPLNQNGQLGAYLALFSEIGLVLLVTTLMGVAGGLWLDDRIGTRPLFVLVGFLGGAGVGAVGIYRLISRFLARFG